MAAENGTEALVEPPDEEGDSGFHFAETDPSQRFGRFDQVLGRGAFKVVYKAFDTQEGTEVAWNQVRVSELMSAKDADNKEERDRLFAEIRVLKALKHKNIMSFYDSWYDPKTATVNFITELFTSGTLRQYRKRHKHIDEEVLKRWAWQILCGLVYLHGHNPPIIHRDLKCDNIFINGSDGVVKIGDLGLATMLRSRTAPQSVLGTPEFMAPELYEEDYDDRVDVYSFGMCLLELSTMEYPYAECKNAAQIYRKVSLGVRPAGLQKVVSKELGEFINLCISTRETRPRARQLLKHPYFDSIRKDKLLTSVRSDAALSATTGADGTSEYGSLASGPVSRTASSLNEMVAAAMASAGHSAGGLAPLQGPPSAGSVAAATAPQNLLSRTPSADAHSERAPSDSASVRSQRSNASELAMAVLSNIAEETETTEGNGEVGGELPGVRSEQASKHVSPHGTPPGATTPVKPGSPTSSDGCRCDATERRFSVRGDLLEGHNRIQLRLRICEPTGTTRTVEFEFDGAVDTAASVAGEMVRDLELTPDDAAVIAYTLKSELERLFEREQMDPQASQSLAKAAQVIGRELTTSALEQAASLRDARDPALAPPTSFLASREPSLASPGMHSALASREPSLVVNGIVANGIAAALIAREPSLVSGSRQFGRFSEHMVLVSPPSPRPLPLRAPQQPTAAGMPGQGAASAPPSAPTSEGVPSNRPSTDGQSPQSSQQLPPLPLRRSHSTFGSGSSLVSVSSASSIPSVPITAALAASQLAAEQAALPSLARLSPPPRAPFMQPADGRPSQRPMSPLAGAVGAPPSDFPSPSQRVMRSNSVDAMTLLTRSGSLPPGRDAGASPLDVGSGALSPRSGILSPSSSAHEKRVPLHKLFDNLNAVAQDRIDSPGRAAAAMNGSGTQSAALPPLPHSHSGRALLTSISNGSMAMAEAAAAAAAAAAVMAGSDAAAAASLLRPRSEACLSSLPRGVLGRMSPVPGSPAPGSAPSTSTMLAAALSDPPGMAALASPRSVSSNASPRSATTAAAVVAAAAADAIHRLDLQTSAPGGLVALAHGAAPRVVAHALSAPPSKVPSRDVSPTREGSLSPTRPDAACANGKRLPIKDKEALRRQAANAMKAVELRSLNLLEGGLCAGKATRGVPMAAARSMTSLVGAPLSAQQQAQGAPCGPNPALTQQLQQHTSLPNGIPAGASASVQVQLQPSAGSIPQGPPPLKSLSAPPAMAALPALVPPPSSAS